MQWVLQQADSTSRLPLSVLTQSIQGYFDLDLSNRHFVRTCAVSSQWPLSVYEVLVAHDCKYRFLPDPVRLRTRHVESAYRHCCRDPFKKTRFLGFLKNLKNLKVRFLGFLGFLIFKSEFLLYHVKLCKFI